ncbi:DUF3800 domain-containing protein [Mahella australiensis]|uniref:DUF3800 domain-containing protein n=1 Tax=Mahella australiensis (strain DSM 15567 / CIP 107919 / 50-1 BON) TaxID=697281 RepID=F4A0Y0_MAHA5|nr:DUF3800 domain-containing protein [Mahella australiensis]AEE98057.1 hypothetical protein Mahau_2936 [Mahella australiensis 50-1 BON]
MYLVYCDESGDDGYPYYSSELFVLTSIYMHDLSWKQNYDKMVNFRRKLKRDYGFPIKLEFHTKAFLTDKKPYRQFNWTENEKKQILYDLFNFIASLDIKIINTIINKKKIISPDYRVLETAVTYGTQRIENDLNQYCDKCVYDNICSECNFLIITDEGRIGKMRKVTRKIQKINYIPSKYGNPYHKEVKRIIEDLLPKNSKESYFLQVSDAIAYIVYLHVLINFNKGKLPNRVANKININDIANLLGIIRNRINFKAGPQNEFGLVIYPR